MRYDVLPRLLDAKQVAEMLHTQVQMVNYKKTTSWALITGYIAVSRTA